MFKYEEYKTVNQFWGWVIILVFSALIIGWGLLVHTVVPDAPRRWDFGSLDDTPGSSKYSTLPPPVEPNAVPLQIAPPILQQDHYSK